MRKDTPGDGNVLLGPLVQSTDLDIRGGIQGGTLTLVVGISSAVPPRQELMPKGD